MARIKISDHKEYRVSFGDNKNVLKFIIGMAALQCENTKSHWIVHFKWTNYMVGEFYLNEILLKR